MNEVKLKICENYAKKFNKREEREERERLKTKYGDVDDYSSSSSTSESEDDDGKDLTEETDRTIYRILAALQSKDLRCYDPSYKFFDDRADENSEEEEEDADKASKKKKKKEKAEKPMFLEDYEWKVITEREGKLDDDTETEEEDEAKKPVGYYEQQEERLKSIQKALAEHDNENDDEFVDLKPKVYSGDEKKKKEEDYLEWLKGQKNGIDESLAKDLEPLRNFYNDPNLDEKEKFLRDYFLNKRYKDDNESELDEEEVLKEAEADEKEFDAEELFAVKVNHRFEEPDKEFIKSYPRTIGQSLRNKDNKRSEKRKQAKEKKLAEKQKEKEELKRLKNLKKKEIQEKLEKLKMITGNDSVDFTEEDFEEDFDPRKHDAVMEKLIGEDYYDQDADDEKPIFSPEDFDDIEETWESEVYYEVDGEEKDNSKPSSKEPQPGPSKGHAWADGEDDKTEKPKNRKKTKFAEELHKIKQTLDSNKMSREEYINEILSRMDYEDKVGDVTFRFGYRNVTPCDYGLTAEEVLKAPERELNSWVSVKKMSQYRTEEEEKWEVKLYKKKSYDIRKKFNFLPSLRLDNSTDQNEGGAAPSTSKAPEDSNQTASQKKRQKRKRKQTVEDDSGSKKFQQNAASSDIHTKEIKFPKAKKSKANSGNTSTCQVENFVAESHGTEKPGAEVRAGEEEKKKKRKKHRPSIPTMSSDRLEAYGINEKKFKYVIQNKLHQEMKKKQKL